MIKYSMGILLFILAMVSTQIVWAAERIVKVVQPVNNEQLNSPVKVCMEVSGLIVEKVKKGVNEGRGHHPYPIKTRPAIFVYYFIDLRF